MAMCWTDNTTALAGTLIDGAAGQRWRDPSSNTYMCAQYKALTHIRADTRTKGNVIEDIYILMTSRAYLSYVT